MSFKNSHTYGAMLSYMLVSFCIYLRIILVRESQVIVDVDVDVVIV